MIRTNVKVHGVTAQSNSKINFLEGNLFQNKIIKLGLVSVVLSKCVLKAIFRQVKV